MSCKIFLPSRSLYSYHIICMMTPSCLLLWSLLRHLFTSHCTVPPFYSLCLQHRSVSHDRCSDLWKVSYMWRQNYWKWLMWKNILFLRTRGENKLYSSHVHTYVPSRNDWNIANCNIKQQLKKNLSLFKRYDVEIKSTKGTCQDDFTWSCSVFRLAVLSFEALYYVFFIRKSYHIHVRKFWQKWHLEGVFNFHSVLFSLFKGVSMETYSTGAVFARSFFHHKRKGQVTDKI